jgi:hypothetical protein
MIRIAAASVAALGVVAGGMLAATPSAFALKQGCGGTTLVTQWGVEGPGQQAFVYGVFQNNTCPGGTPLPLVTISKYVTGVGWEEVASSTTGSATYNCTGGRALYTTNVTPANDDFYCG